MFLTVFLRLICFKFSFISFPLPFPERITRRFQYRQCSGIIASYLSSLSLSSRRLVWVHTQTLAGKERWQPVQLEYGYFWMLRDLRQSEEQPIVANSTLIDETQAKLFPTLTGLQCLDETSSSSNNSSIEIPAHWLRKNRTRDPSAQCTLVGISFRDYGYTMLKDWCQPFQQSFANNDRVETVRLNLNEGYLTKYLLKSIITASMRKNTPLEEKASTYLYFGTDLNPILRDPLRAHNLLTGYVYLLDGLGRVRYAASGPASPEKVDNLTALAQELLRPTTQHQSGSAKRSKR